MKTLVTKHNAGFFSCCTYRLTDIVEYINTNKELPEYIDSSAQFSFYKSNQKEDLIPLYFSQDSNVIIDTDYPLVLSTTTNELQFSDYSLINFSCTTPLVNKFFKPSKVVADWVKYFTDVYCLDYNNLCAVFYRGNDKSRETPIASYSVFIEKAQYLLNNNPNLQFLVQPDETEFLETFLDKFPNNTIWFEETPHMPRKDSCIFYELPQKERPLYGAKFFAAVLCLSKCKHLITHSGNGGNWALFYRGHSNNVYQWLINKWL